MDQQRPLIMISNDDGIQARGIAALARVASRVADVVVVAPDRGYSGQSHSITVCKPLAVLQYNIGIQGVKALMVSGSPVDCVKLGVHALVDRTPSLILSGINHGSNTSSSVHYSGTMAVVREAALLGIPSVGFSLCDEDEDADFTQAMIVADEIIQWILNSPTTNGIFYGVNVPTGMVKGIKPVRLAGGYWHEEATVASDPWGKKYYWLNGDFIDTTPDATDTDQYWLMQGYATICPCKIEVTSFETLQLLKTKWK